LKTGDFTRYLGEDGQNACGPQISAELRATSR